MSAIRFFTSFPSFIYYILFLLIIGIFAFSKTFHLALLGDEWYVMWVVKNSVVTNGQWDLHINQTIPGYRIGALLMYLLTEYFGYDGKGVYIFSFITRFVATLTLFYFLRKRACSNKAAFLGALFFLVTPIGLQATDWAKNFTSYISTSFFLPCINSIYSLRSWKNVFIFLLTFSISIYINPIRAPGIILTTSFLLIFQYLFNKSVEGRIIISSLLCSLIIGFMLLKMLVSESAIGQQIILTLMQFPHSAEKFFASIGAAILPQPSFHYLGLLIVTLLLWKRYLLSKKYLLFTIGLHTITVPILFESFFHIPNDKMFTILGIYFTLFMTSIFIIELFNKKISEALNTVIPLLLTVFFLITPLIVGTLGVDPTHRYMIYSALSLPMIIAFSLNQNALEDSGKKLFPFFKQNSINFYIVLFFLLMNYLSLNSEINKMYINHNQNTANIIWQQITPYFNNYDFKNHRPHLFIDTNNGAVVHDTVTFGLGFHMGYIYKIWSYDANDMWKLPLAVDSFADFNSMLTDGKATKKYFGDNTKDFVFPKEDAFYFKIDGLKVSRIVDY